MITAQQIAYYTATKKVKFLTIFPNPQSREEIKRVEVSGKVEAKKYCKDNNIKPWNF